MTMADMLYCDQCYAIIRNVLYAQAAIVLGLEKHNCYNCYAKSHKLHQ